MTLLVRITPSFLNLRSRSSETTRGPMQTQPGACLSSKGSSAQKLVDPLPRSPSYWNRRRGCVNCATEKKKYLLPKLLKPCRDRTEGKFFGGLRFVETLSSAESSILQLTEAE